MSLFFTIGTRMIRQKPTRINGMATFPTSGTAKRTEFSSSRIHDCMI